MVPTRLLSLPPLVLMLTSAVGLWLPAAGYADCGCGPGCGCGAGCTCGTWTEPPPRDPGANNVRKNQSALTPEERQAFVAAVLELKNRYHDGSAISIYDEYVHAHMQMMMFQPLDLHRGTAFLPWHRALLDYFERELQAVDPTVTIPYWDFTVDNRPDAAPWTADFMGGNGDPDDQVVRTGPFRSGEWVVVVSDTAFDGPDLRRNLGAFPTLTLPTPQQVQDALAVTTYDVFPFDDGSPIDQSFRNSMAGWNYPTGEPEMHNRVHNWVNGSMATMSSPNDPIFFLHHANIDRIWALWQQTNGLQYPDSDPLYGQDVNWPMPPFGIPPAAVLDKDALGYYYDTEGGGSPRPNPGRSPQSAPAVPATANAPKVVSGNVGEDAIQLLQALAGKGGGQVSLADWRAAGGSVAAFRRMDLNDDGVITGEEMRRVLAGRN